MSPDFSDLIHELNAHEVEYLIVGAHALAAYGHVRATKDLDVWVRADLTNAKRVLGALSSFGAPLHDLSESDLTHAGTIFQIGTPPLRIDIITAIDGVEFAEAWGDRVETKLADERVSVISRHHLIANKKASGRVQDLADLEALSRLQV